MSGEGNFEEVRRGLEIFAKYLEAENPGEINAEHDEIFVCNILPAVIIDDDMRELKKLGWRWDGGLECWAKFV